MTDTTTHNAVHAEAPGDASPEPAADGGQVVHDGPRSNPLALIVLFVGAIVLGQRFGANLPLIIVGIALMIFFHELGHFLTAKWTGMKATEFFLGFGPTLWSFRRGETEYGLKLIPAGAYVKIIGMHNLDPVEPADEAKAFRQKSYPQRVLVAAAGSIMHFILATLLFVVAYSFVGVPDENNWYVASIAEDSPIAAAGLLEDDVPVELNGQPLQNFGDLGTQLVGMADQPFRLVVLRSGQRVELNGITGWRLNAAAAAKIEGLLPRDQVLAVNGVAVTTYDSFLDLVEPGGTYSALVQGRIADDIVEFTSQIVVRDEVADGAAGYLGLGRGLRAEPMGVGTGTVEGLQAVGSRTGLVVKGMGSFFSRAGFRDTFTNAFNRSELTSEPAPDAVITETDRLEANSRDENRAISIIGAARAGKQIADETGWGATLAMFAILNISVGLLNLLPLLPLDGGHIVVATYERLRSRAGRRYHADFAKALPVTYVIVALMATMFVFTTLRDIFDPLNL